MPTYSKASVDQREVGIALADFFVDKPFLQRKELSPWASQLAWGLKKLVGNVSYEDLDNILLDCPTTRAFATFTQRVTALEKGLPAGQKPCAALNQLAGLNDLALAEQVARGLGIKPAPALDV